jgi:hypothetical protein
MYMEKFIRGEGEEDEEDEIYLMSQYIDIPDEVQGTNKL